MAGFLILPLLLNCLWWSGCGAVWRYTTSTGRYFIFSTSTTIIPEIIYLCRIGKEEKNGGSAPILTSLTFQQLSIPSTMVSFWTDCKIYLEYEGTGFNHWKISSFCSIPKGMNVLEKAEMFCPVPGSHRIQPNVASPSADDEERYLYIKADMNCFLWYIYQNRSGADYPDQIIKVWLFDPENADDKEKLNTAVSPPLYSSTLSKQFWNLGQMPIIRTLFTETEYYSTSFTDGVWTFQVPGETNDNIATITGKVVTFQDCFVQNVPFTIRQPIHILGLETGVSVTLPAGSEAKIEWCSCYPRTAVIVTVDGMFHTSNAFLNVAEIKFPPTLIPDALRHKVKDIGIVFPNVFILIENMLYQARRGNIINLGDIYFPEIKLIGLQTQTWCSGAYPQTETELSEMILWSEDEVFLGYYGDEFNSLTNTRLLKEKLKLKRTVSLLIISACYDSLIASVVILIECTGCTSKKVLYLAAYKEDTDKWILKDFILDVPAVGTIHMEVILSASTSMVLWDDHTIFYTYKEHKQHGYLQDSETKSIFSAESKGSIIHQIITDYIGNTIVKLENNALYFFKFEVIDVIRLTPWENNLKKFIFYFNPSGDMFLVTINGTNITSKVYPLKLEVLSSASKLNDVCPYISFEDNVDLNIHYVDIGDKIAFWGQIVFLENYGLSVDVEIYRPELLKTKEVIHYEIAREICTKNKTVTFYHERDYSELPDYQTQIKLSQGTVTFEFQPSETGKTCLTRNKLSHILVGCPPWKDIFVPMKPSDCEDFTFQIPRMYLRDKSHKGNKVVEFDSSQYGCPLQSHYTQDFLPNVEIFEQSGTITPVKVNYIVWEVNGRIDFSYKATMEKVRCLNTAQTWDQMIKLYNKSIEDIENVEEIWGPHNYKSCFKKRSEQLTKLDGRYEILNDSGLNSLSWPQHSSIYMFKLIILDPNFSFCNFSTYFAVQTYGIIQRPSWIHIAGWNILLLTIFWAFLIFSYFRYVKIFRAFPFVDPLMSLRPLRQNVTDEKVFDQKKD